jgi:hypothetical protein
MLMNSSEIEKQFLASWDSVERFFAQNDRDEEYKYLLHMLPLISELRQRGYDKHFRAGQSLHSLVLSRAIKRGLRREQPRVAIEPRPDGSMIIFYYGRETSDPERIELKQLAYCSEIEIALSKLMTHPLD